MLARATNLLPQQTQQAFYSPQRQLAVVVCGGPLQSIIRPSELENEQLIENLSKIALFGPQAVLNRREGLEDSQLKHSLLLKQESGSLLINEQGSVSLWLNLNRTKDMTLVEEDIREMLFKALTFIDKILSEIDATNRLFPLSY